MNTNHTAPRQRGFTLIELMVTLFVMGILLTLGLPQFSEMTAAQQQRAAASALFDSLSLARSEAVKRNAEVSISGTELGGGWNVTLGDNTVLHTQQRFAGVSFTPAAASIVYNTRGRLTTGATSIQVKSARSSACRVVSIGSNGRPRVFNYSDGCP